MRTVVITDTVSAMKRIPLVFVGLTTVALGLSACGASGEASTAGESPAGATETSNAQIVATTTIWGDIAGQIAECAGGSVTTLMPVGADPHDFTPSSEQVATMVNADLVIANGLGLEEGLESALGSAQQDGAAVFEVAPLLDPIPFGEEGEHAEEEGEHAEEEGEHAEEEGEEHGHDGDDPHVWLDVTRVSTAAELIGSEMAEVTGDAAYQECGVEVADELKAVNDEVVQTLAAIPAEQRILVTDHDAFGYFAAAYDFEVAGVVIPGGSTLAEPSSAELAELVATVQATGVPAVFSNTANPSALVDALAAEVGDIEVVELYVGSLGEPGSGADTYQGMMNTNATRIADALSN
jgi:zinc/manganese transport system substrate-binding protein